MAKVLFFTRGPVPTKDELEAAEKLGTKMFRNAAADEGFMEKADAYAGAVPERYKAKTTSPTAAPSKTAAPAQPPVQPPPQQPSGAAIPPWAGK